MKSPTDLAIVRWIYNRYYSEFVSYENDPNGRKTKIYVPIDVDEIGDRFSVDGDIIFGRLYYHLNPKYGYTNPDGSKVQVFAPSIGIQFPLLAAILADLSEDRNRYRTATLIALFSLAVSFVSILMSMAAEARFKAGSPQPSNGPRDYGKMVSNKSGGNQGHA